MAQNVSVINEGTTTEVQWGEEPQRPSGYALIVDGKLYVPFRDENDEAFVFCLAGSDTRIVSSEDIPPALDHQVVWRPVKESQVSS